jgi:transposase
VSDTSRRWGEFRFAVVGHLVFSGVERGKLAPELWSLSAKKWKHPISGRWVTLAFSTIQRWYYTALNNPEAPIYALTTRRRDAGVPRRLSKEAQHRLARQADRNFSWTYKRHHSALLSYLKERGCGSPPGYLTVRRYIKSRCISQDAANAKIIKLQGLVLHLRRTLIVQSTQARLLRVPEVRPKAAGSSLKFRRFQPHEKAYILSRLRDFRSTGGSQAAFCCGTGISTGSIARLLSSHRQYGENGLRNRKRRKFSNRTKAQATRKQILEIFHNPPRTYGINRTNWTGKSLAKALFKQFGVTISGSTATRHLRKSGYTMRRARQVLTSSDPDYTAKVETLLQTLRALGKSELLFFVDELGPLAIKKYGGRMFAKSGDALVVPQHQNPKGSLALVGALSATTNQMTWCYTLSKDTAAMIDLIEIIFNQHLNKTRLYMVWDAASWHDSTSLVDWIDAFNRKTMETEGPVITLVPLPSRSQFLNVIESAFGVMKKAIIHHSDYQSPHEMKSAISQHFCDRNVHFKDNPRRAGSKIWDIDFFHYPECLPSGNYREY